MDLKQKKILVTGGAGFVGSCVVKKLITRGVPAANIFLPRSKEYDLRALHDCEKVVEGKEIVIHLAAVTGNLEFHAQHPGSNFYDNLLMGTQLMEAARRAGVKKFVGVGTAAEHPEFGTMPLAEDNLWDGYPEKIHAPYALTKKMLLVQGLAYAAQYGFSALHLLLTNVYGPGERIESGYVIPSIIKKILASKKNGNAPIQIWGSGEARREFLYVDDAAEAIVRATERYENPAPVNIGTGQETPIKELAVLIARLLEYDGEIRYDGSKPEGQLRRCLDVRRAEQHFGFKAQTSLADGLCATISWYKKFF